jgi:cell division protein FtsI/penicillin-binding protein 2
MLGLLVLLLAAVSARLVYLQVVAAPALAEEAAGQRTKDIELAPRRGSIYDREGQPLAVSMEARTIYATPYAVTEPEATAEALAGVLGGTAEDYIPQLTKDSGFAYIGRKVDMERAAAVEALELPGIGFLEDSRRTYPSGELACQILGFVGIDDDGLAGLESYYDELLGGRPGTVLAERDPFGRPIPGGIMRYEEPVNGQNMVLTIDKDIQYELQAGLAEAVKTWGAKGGSAVVMKADTGEILAAGTVPGFNPNDYGEAEPYTFRNRVLTDAYEPGSTMKPFTAAAALEAGLYEPGTAFKLPPSIKVADRTIGESHPRPTKNWTLTQIITFSSNVGAVKLGQALGEEGLYDGLAAFGFDRSTGVDFPGESAGYLPPVEVWSPSTIGNVPFGQGVSSTQLQLARAYAVIANGGELVTPHFLKEIPDDAGAELSWPKERVLSEETAAQSREILATVVTEGTGEAAAVEGYTVAGKTGTAQKARSDGGGYAEGKYVASFAGFLPVEDPQVVIVVAIDEPSNAIYGGAVAGPTFSRLAEFSVSHLRIPPSSVREVSVDGSSTPVSE